VYALSAVLALAKTGVCYDGFDPPVKRIWVVTAGLIFILLLCLGWFVFAGPNSFPPKPRPPPRVPLPPPVPIQKVAK
jgi:hypothetical protein